MAQGRFLSRTTATSKQLDAVSWRAELLFLRSIPHLDRDGRMDGDPIVVKATAAPRNPKLPAGAIAGLLQELHDAGLVVWYRVGEDQVLAFPTFREHQQGLKYDRERPSRFAPPPGWSPVPPKSGPTPAKVRSNSGEPPEPVRTNGGLREGKGSSSSSLSLSSSSRAQSSHHQEGVSPNGTQPAGFVDPTPEEREDLERRKAAAKAQVLAVRDARLAAEAAG